jgi:hypothetical protein
MTLTPVSFGRTFPKESIVKSPVYGAHCGRTGLAGRSLLMPVARRQRLQRADVVIEPGGSRKRTQKDLQQVGDFRRPANGEAHMASEVVSRAR